VGASREVKAIYFWRQFGSSAVFLEVVDVAVKCLEINVDEYTVHYYERDDEMPVVIREARYRGVPLCGPYSFRKDAPHSPLGQYHIHVYRKGDQLFAINADGTAHDQSHGVRIPNKVADALRKTFPDVVLPAANVIESDAEGFFGFWVAVLEDE
jgi:hypothetical protein